MAKQRKGKKKALSIQKKSRRGRIVRRTGLVAGAALGSPLGPGGLILGGYAGNKLGKHLAKKRYGLTAAELDRLSKERKKKAKYVL